MVSIAGLNKAEVLLALWNGSKAQGMSFMSLPSDGVSLEDCRAALKIDTGFDYWNGHVLKVDLSGDAFDPRLYDRDNGQGAASAAIEDLRSLRSAA